MQFQSIIVHAAQSIRMYFPQHKISKNGQTSCDVNYFIINTYRITERTKMHLIYDFFPHYTSYLATAALSEMHSLQYEDYLISRHHEISNKSEQNL